MRHLILYLLLALLGACALADSSQAASHVTAIGDGTASKPSGFIAGVRQVLEVVEGAGNLGFALLLCFFCAVVCLSLPTTPIELSAGFMYGSIWGCFAGVAGKTVGSFIAYMIARTVGEKRGWKVPEKIESYMSALREKPIITMVGIRVAPLPLGLKNYGLALCKVDAFSYIVASLIVNTPFSVMWGSLGASCASLGDALNFDTSKVNILGDVPDWAKALLATVAVVGVGFIVMKRMSGKPTEMKEKKS